MLYEVKIFMVKSIIITFSCIISVSYSEQQDFPGKVLIYLVGYSDNSHYSAFQIESGKVYVRILWVF